MSLAFYKVLHLVGVIMLFMAIGGAILSNIQKDDGPVSRKMLSMMHGIGLLIILVAGFGMLPKLGIGFPMWVILKIVLWGVFGGIIVWIKRAPQSGMLIWYIAILLGICASYLAIYKPF